MAAAGSLTTQVLNSADGVPASRLAVSLHLLDSTLKIWSLLSLGTTDEDGRCPGLGGGGPLRPGMYRLRFETGPYWEGRGHAPFYPYVEVVFTITNPQQRLHLHLLMSRFSYSTYRGS